MCELYHYDIFDPQKLIKDHNKPSNDLYIVCALLNCLDDLVLFFYIGSEIIVPVPYFSFVLNSVRYWSSIVANLGP